MSVCLILFAYAAGLVAPGYLCARLLGGRTPWATAVPLSTLILFLGTELFDVAGIPLLPGPMLAWELAVVAALAVAVWKWSPKRTILDLGGSPAPPANGASWQNSMLLAGVALLGVLAIVRGFQAPLSGYDTLFRWDFLPRQLLNQHNLAFYPPITPGDFHIYFHPDGFAPLVSMSYWWIYALSGQTQPESVMPLAMVQYGGTVVLAYHLAKELANRRAGVLAAAVLAATPLFFRAVLIGQETGLTAIGMAGMMLALVQAESPNDTRALVLAGLLAAVAGLAREYGPAFAACGALVLLGRRMSWRALLQFSAVVALLVLPWNLRNWIHSGNPLYNHPLGVFPTNPVFEAMMQEYKKLLGLLNYNAAAWRALAGQFLTDAGWQVVVGIPAAIWLWRRAGWLAGGAAVGGALWLWLAVAGLMPGGTAYSMRMLSPATVLLAVAAAVGLERLGRAPGRQWIVTTLVFVSVLYGSVCAAVFPYPLDPAGRPAFWTALTARWHPGMAELGLQDPSLAKLLPPGTRILTENAYAHSVLAGSTYDLVPIWSPEVAFLFDQKLSPLEQRRRLLALHITTLLYYPNSPNTAYCMEHSPFYAQDSGHWHILAQAGNVFALCALPPAD